MSEAKDPNKPKFDKGDRAAIVNGNKPLGTRGEVFWVGENKYGPGWRFGMKGDDGRTYWLNDEEIGDEDGAPPAPPPPERPELDKGTRVKIVAGKDAGAEGEIFWTGHSKYGPGMRYGIKEGEDTYWADEAEVEVIEAAPAANATGGPDSPEEPPPAGPMPIDDAVPDEGELPPEAYEHNLTEDDIPF
jgi:hypothetical protein